MKTLSFSPALASAMSCLREPNIARAHAVRRAAQHARRLPLRPDVPVTVLRIGILERLLEPWMLVRCVIDHEVDEHTYAALLRAVGEFDKIADCAVARIDAVIIGHVVAVIAMGRDLERHQPDGRDAETMQIIETAHQTLEVADAVAVGIHVGSNRQAIDYRVLVPKVVDHRATRWSD